MSTDAVRAAPPAEVEGLTSQAALWAGARAGLCLPPNTPREAVADALAAARAALSEPAPGVPEGWQLVPKEPTEAMVDDGCEAIKGEHYTGTWGECGGVSWSESRAAYEAMLAAAPSPTAPPSTPNASLPPLGEGPRTKIQITVEVPADWANRLDMQWVLEREIHADRWAWNWPTTAPQEPTP